MKNLRLEIAFDGSNFHGWQFQSTSLPTIQGELNKALAKVYKTKVKTMGSGRTDAKVHAVKYYAFYEAPFEIIPSAIVMGLNSNLPPEIRVLNAEKLDKPVHATIDAKYRDYRYYFSNDKIQNPFLVNFVSNNSYPLDFDEMSKACKAFIGTYDFASYQTMGSDVKTSERTIINCELHKFAMPKNDLFPTCHLIEVRGSGFLKQMVRMMVGAIWDVGRGKTTVEQIQKSLTTDVGVHISPVAPAQGLYKFDVSYE